MIRKKLLYVARPQSGGMLKHLRTLIAYFSRRWDVCLAAPSAVLTPVHQDGGVVKYFKLPLAGDAAPFRDMAVLARLVKICREERIDMIHVHGYKAAFVTLPAAKLCRCPALMTVHNSLLYPEKSIFPRGYYHRVVKALDPFVSSYIAVSEKLRQDLIELGINPGKIVKIYNGINFREFGPNSTFFECQPREREGEAGLLWDFPGLKVGTAGRLVSHKGIDIFIKAAAKIASRYPHVRFFIAGEGPERMNLEALRDFLGLQGKVFFLGNIRQMAAFLSSLDIFVLASRSEGLSISLLEAGCAGLPLVASSTGGIPEIVQDGITGLLVPVEDVASLTEAVSLLIADSQKRKNLGIEAAKEIQKRFTEENMLKETEKVYEEIIQGKTETLAEKKQWL